MTFVLSGEVLAAEDKDVKGLPQLDFTTYSEQIFWLFVFFIILHVFFSKKTIPEISSTIEMRKEQIQGDLDSAETLKDDAEKVQQAYEEIMTSARQKSSEAFTSADAQIKTLNEEKLNAFKGRSAKANEEIEGKIEAAKTAAISDMNNIAAEIASKAAEKIVGISTDLDQAKSMVENIGRKAA